MAETVFVIGSNSFSGSHFVRKLLTAGYQVTGVSRSPEPNSVFLPYRWEHTDGFTFYQIDLNSDLDALMELVRQAKPSYVVNFAAQGMVAESWKKPGDWLRTNTLAQVLLHDQLRRCDFLKKYVHVSTPEVYGPIPDPTPESTVYRPSTPYAVSRSAADMSLHAFFKAYAFPVVFTRAGNVYGPGQQLYRLIPRTAVAALGGERMRLNNAGASRRSFVHIRDVVDATQLVMERGRVGEIYHIATQRLSSVREAAETTAAAAGVSLMNVADIGPGRLGRDSVYNLDSGKIRSELGWKDTVTLEAGTRETVEWVRRHYGVLRHMPLTYEHKA